jgi:glycosyltransferase involved in cell wall biosynthesis
MISFGILTISHGRPNVLKIFCASIKRLKLDLGTHIPCVCVGDEEHADICAEYGIWHIPHLNQPATAKWNRGVEYLMSLGVDYVIVMGSDDIMSTELLKNLIGAMEKGYDLIGINEIYFYAGDGRHRGLLRLLSSPHAIYGVARTISSRIIKETHPMWRSNKSWGMDGDCLRTIKPYVKTIKIVNGLCFDIKTMDTQMNRFTFWMSKLHMNYPKELFLNILGEEEKQILNTL